MLWAGTALWNVAECGRSFSNVVQVPAAGSGGQPGWLGCSCAVAPVHAEFLLGLYKGSSPSSPGSRPGAAAVAHPLVLQPQLLALPWNCGSQCTVWKGLGKSLLKFAHLWGDWLADPECSFIQILIQSQDFIWAFMGVALIVRMAWSDIGLLPISCCSGNLSVLKTLSMTWSLLYGKPPTNSPYCTAVCIYTTASFQQEVFWHQRKLLAPENPKHLMVWEWQQHTICFAVFREGDWENDWFPTFAL